MNLWGDPDWKSKHYECPKWYETEGTEVLAFVFGIGFLMLLLMYC